ncbi:MAG: IS200/IS605 family transposase [Chloroflexia bacterium]
MASTFVHTPRYNPIARPPGYRYVDGRLSLLRYHLVWVVRRRRPVLVGPVAARLEEVLRQTAAELDLEILGLSVHPDHVHLHVAATPELAPSQIVYRFKVATAAALRSEFSELKKLPSMWNGSFLVSSDKELAQEDIDRYVQAHNTRA